MAFCVKCGTKIEEGVKFCPGCGSPASPAGGETRQETAAVNTIQAQPAPASAVQSSAAAPSASPSPDEKYCFSCGGVIKKEAVMCPKCGVTQSTRSTTASIDVYCSSCGKTIKKEAAICPFCGVQQFSGGKAAAQGPAKDKKELAIASLALGIGGIGFTLLQYLNIPDIIKVIFAALGLAALIVGLIFGIRGLKSSKKGFAIAGIVLAGVGLIAAVALDAYMETTGQSIFGSSSQSQSTFTITNIPPEYNGMYAIINDGTDRRETIVIAGFESINQSAETITMSRISNGRVSIPVWDVGSGDNFVRYTGNHTMEWMEVYIFSSSSSTVRAAAFDPIAEIEFENVPFTNGGATVSASSGQLYR